MSSPVSCLYGHLRLGYDGRTFIQSLVDFVQLILLSLQFVTVDVYNQVVEPLHLIFHLPCFTGRSLIVCKDILYINHNFVIAWYSQTFHLLLIYHLECGYVLATCKKYLYRLLKSEF